MVTHFALPAAPQRILIAAMERIVLGLVVAAAFALRATGLEQNGWGADYYAAAARSMAASWHNFFYAAFDPAGFISVDKPPVALWIQALSVRLFGFAPASVLWPQVLEGVACVIVLHVVVRRSFGAAAALLAAFSLALTPVMVAVNRTNNMDSCLVLVLLLAAGALLEAVRTGRHAWLAGAMALVGVAFNVKMLAGFVVLPAFVLTYLVAAPVPLRRRLADLAIGGVFTAAIAMSWIAAFDATPPESRPYAGGSLTNSMLELTLGHNAASRFVRRGAPDASEPRAATIGERLFVRAPPGPLRLAEGQLAAQAGWLAPLAAVAIFLGFRQGAFRRPLGPRGQALLFWSCWIATYAVVLSFAGGIVHYYYLAPVAPAFAALAAAGALGLWDLCRESDRGRYALAATLLVTALWQWHVHTSALGWRLDAWQLQGDDWRTWLHAALAAGVAIAVAALVSLRGRPAHRVAAVAAGTGLAALLVMPLAWSLSSVLAPGHGVLPSADLYRLDPAVLGSADPRVRGNFGQLMDTTQLAAFLQANKSDETYLVATTTTRLAAPLIIATGANVMAMGGFHGLDRAMTPQRLAQLAADREVRFVMLGDAGPSSRRMGSEAALEPVAAWVRENGRRVAGARWRGAATPRAMVLYDLRPEAGLR